jgi:GcrA cell cycle regulator
VRRTRIFIARKLIALSASFASLALWIAPEIKGNWMGGHVNTIWTDEQSEALTTMLATGKSFSQIAAKLNAQFNTNYSRNAACGKGYRLGLAAPKKAKSPPKERKRIPPKTAIKYFTRVEDIRLRCIEIVPQNVLLLELAPNGCRYPSGEGPFTFCNHHQQPESSYCPAHQALCHSVARRLTDEEKQIRRQRWKKLQKSLNTEQQHEIPCRANRVDGVPSQDGQAPLNPSFEAGDRAPPIGDEAVTSWASPGTEEGRVTDIPLSPFISADPYPPAETAAASVTSPPAAAAGLFPEPPSNEGRPQGAPATDLNPFDAGAADCISEIFVGARKWIDDDHRFVLDEAAFMESLEAMPLFLQVAAGWMGL